MNQQLIETYRQFRQAKPFMLAGQDAKLSLHAAKTLIAFRKLESKGLVRLRAEHEMESPFDVYGEPEGYVNRQGHWVTPEQDRKSVV